MRTYTPCRIAKLQDTRREFRKILEAGTPLELSERTGLAPRTVAKILAREEGVDKRTIDYFFRAFNLNWIPVTIQSLSNFEEIGVQPLPHANI